MSFPDRGRDLSRSDFRNLLRDLLRAVRDHDRRGGLEAGPQDSRDELRRQANRAGAMLHRAGTPARQPSTR